MRGNCLSHVLYLLKLEGGMVDGRSSRRTFRLAVGGKTIEWADDRSSGWVVRHFSWRADDRAERQTG